MLSLSFLLQCSGYLLIYINFVANQDYIAKNLCENRNRPEMKCNGKCQLCKRLKAEDKKENKGLPAMKDLKLFSLYSSPENTFNFTPSDDASKLASVYMDNISTSHEQGVFRPPLG
jgi:hypothetical protein